MYRVTAKEFSWIFYFFNYKLDILDIFYGKYIWIVSEHWWKIMSNGDYIVNE